MKRTATLLLVGVMSIIFSCSKTESTSSSKNQQEPPMTISTHTDPDPIDHPCCPDEDGGGNSDPYSGGSTCTSAYYSVRHGGQQLMYNISFNIVSGAISGLSFTHTFYTATPTIDSFTLLAKTATYNPTNNSVTIYFYYKWVIDDGINKYTQYVTTFDYIYLCEGTFVHSGT